MGGGEHTRRWMSTRFRMLGCGRDRPTAQDHDRFPWSRMVSDVPARYGFSPSSPNIPYPHPQILVHPLSEGLSRTPMLFRGQFPLYLTDNSERSLRSRGVSNCQVDPELGRCGPDDHRDNWTLQPSRLSIIHCSRPQPHSLVIIIPLISESIIESIVEGCP